jgi:hypothetical protein
MDMGRKDGNNMDTCKIKIYGNNMDTCKIKI